MCGCDEDPVLAAVAECCFNVGNRCEVVRIKSVLQSDAEVVVR